MSLALVGVVTFGSLTGAMLPFILRGLKFDPASAFAPFVATLVDVTGLSIVFRSRIPGSAWHALVGGRDERRGGWLAVFWP